MISRSRVPTLSLSLSRSLCDAHTHTYAHVRVLSLSRPLSAKYHQNLCVKVATASSTAATIGGVSDVVVSFRARVVGRSEVGKGLCFLSLHALHRGAPETREIANWQLTQQGKTLKVSCSSICVHRDRRKKRARTAEGERERVGDSRKESEKRQTQARTEGKRQRKRNHVRRAAGKRAHSHTRTSERK